MAAGNPTKTVLRALNIPVPPLTKLNTCLALPPKDIILVITFPKPPVKTDNTLATPDIANNTGPAAAAIAAILTINNLDLSSISINF